MKIHSGPFRVHAGKTVKLNHWPTAVKPVYTSDKEYESLFQQHIDEMSALQDLLYASNRYALLLIFQAMDAAGKDGAIKHVMSGVNPQGCQVYSFKHPARRNCSTTSCGAARFAYRNAGGSASSIDRITKRC